MTDFLVHRGSGIEHEGDFKATLVEDAIHIHLKK